MKNNFQKGYVVPLVITAVVLLLGGGYVYYKTQNKSNSNLNISHFTYPVGGETFNSGEVVPIRWTVDPSYKTVELSLVPGTPDKCSDYTNNGSMGTCKVYGIGSVSNTGSYDWIVGSEKDINNEPVESGDYIISINQENIDGDLFSKYFKVNSAYGSSRSDWTSYASNKYGFSLDYPKILSLQNTDDSFTLSHKVPYAHGNFCDMRGDAQPLTDLTDFNLNGKIVKASLESVLKSEYFYKDTFDQATGKPKSNAGVNSFSTNNISGYVYSFGVEGCGLDTY
ncbi:MAG: hypothetical protein RL536_661, partial [Candidatus Parcubacteria bacterium]